MERKVLRQKVKIKHAKMTSPQIKFRFFHGEVNFAPAKKAEFGKSKVRHSCIIGITLMHKQVTNFLRKLVTKYNDIRTKELKGWKII